MDNTGVDKPYNFVKIYLFNLTQSLDVSGNNNLWYQSYKMIAHF